MVLLCMLAGVLCWLLYGVAVHVAWCSMMSLLYGVTVHVGWCSMMSTLWCCCACWLVFYVGYSMVLLCMLPGVP